MSTPAPEPDTPSVWAAARHVAGHPWQVFIADWNWKAALLSASFRAPLFSLAVLRGPRALSGMAIEIFFRLATGGFWGSLIQAFRASRPAWLSGLCVVILLPGMAHALEYLALRAGHAPHLAAGMRVSVGISILSTLLNWFLMRRGLLITGAGAGRLRDDFRRLPAALMDPLGGRRT
jgi:hypothetical protein